MADRRNRFLPTVFRTGDPVIDRNLDSIYLTFRRLVDHLGETEAITPPRESAHYYLAGSEASSSVPVLSRFPSLKAWSSGAIAITGTAINVMTASSVGVDPGIVVAPAGYHMLRLAYAATADSLVFLTVKVGTSTAATSGWVAAPTGTASILEILATAPTMHPIATTEDKHVTIEILAKTVTGTGTFTILSGGAVSTTLASPWLTEVAENHYDIPVSIPVLLRNNLIPRIVMVRSLRFPADLNGSRGRISTVPTSNGTVNIKKNGGASPVATATLTAAATTVTFTSAGFTVAAGDWLSIEPPTTDDTAADLSITLKGEMI